MSAVTLRAPVRGWRSEVRAAGTVWRREWIRHLGDRTQVAIWLVQPLLFLFALGTGLQTLSGPTTGGVDLRTFIFPGVVCLAVLMSAMISAATIVWDRELGFQRQLLVAPVSRLSIIAGKCLGGTSIAALQGVIVLALGGTVGVPYDPVMLAGALGIVVLLAFAVNAFGVLVAVSVKRPQRFTWAMQLAVMPMFFLSGALYPVSGLPGWLEALNRVNPATYAVDPLRRLVLGHVDLSAAARATVDPGVTWFGWPVPAGLELALVAGIGTGLVLLAARRFTRAT